MKRKNDGTMELSRMVWTFYVMVTTLMAVGALHLAFQ